MAIEDYTFENRIFFAREVGVISVSEAEEWAHKLAAYAASSEQPIVALVDALHAGLITMAVNDVFSKASFTPNLLAVVVATSPRVTLVAKTIGMLGKPGHTKVFPSLETAREYAESLVNPID
ncbi:MAG: hypothetical protein IAE80_15860 [Anaerolinea sp.]|nr:hypothetical protein [Anaerolinea sp.]